MIRPSHLFTYDPSTPSGVQELISTRLEGKLSVSPTYQASDAEVARNVETDVRRGGSDDSEGPTPSTIPG